jgi:CRISPR-associated endonuclease/helicase Cas3
MKCDDDTPAQVVPVYQWRIWAKWSKTGENAPDEGETYHPLLCHMLDVATVARQLWANALPAPVRERLTGHLGLADEATTAAWISFFTGLHDIGKASPGFQDQLRDTSAGPTIRDWMREARLAFTDSEWVAHGAVSALVLGYMLVDLGVSEQLADQIAKLVGGHHGVFPRQLDLNKLKGRQQVGYDNWNTAREELVAVLRKGLRTPESAPTGTLTPADAMVFAGFVTVADWLGSNEDYFHHAGRLAATPKPMALEEYVALAEKAAVEALRTVRLDPFIGVPEGRTRRTFAELFPKIKQPRDAQTAMIELADSLTDPALVTLEAPMGEGKTEAALYLAETWSVTQSRQGMYIALPTQATSNQMYERVLKYLQLRFRSTDTDYVAAHLVYGQAPLNESYQTLLDQGRIVLRSAQSTPIEQVKPVVGEENGVGAADPALARNAPALSLEPLPLERAGPVYDGPGEAASEEGAVIAVEWFTAPKRALLAPFGVGTIDQALLGVLQTKHFFVRLFGLAGKTVIVDEVHAYDTYMSALLERLLEWLGAFGTPVALLSATLPQAKRTQLQEAYARGAGWPASNSHALATAYPRLTALTAEGISSRHVAASREMSHRIDVEWLDIASPDSEEGLAALGECLRSALFEGGCAAVLCNTVGHAQAVYTALCKYFPNLADDGHPELELLHARFLSGDRAKREERVVRRFGNGDDARRPHRAILVATQVIEQSLDLDFDVMISDLAPVDLLLQRLGRLHRHRENDFQRPPAVRSPRLIIPRPEESDGCPRFPQSDEFVYDTHILLRTWLALQPSIRTRIQTPEDIETLVEQIYNPDAICPEDASPSVHAMWERTLDKREYSIESDLNEARIRRVPSPKDDSVYTGRNLNLREEDDAPHAEETALALTRLGPPSVRAVLLPAVWAQRQQEAKGQPPNRRTTLRLLRRSVPIAHGAVAPALIQQEPPASWKKSPWLRHARLVALDSSGQAVISTNGKREAKSRPYSLTLDPELGVIIKRQREET